MDLTAAPRPAPRPGGKAIRVLLVNDNRMLLWGLEQLIENEHPRMQVVGKVGTAADALAALDSIEPDIVVLDPHLADENAVTAIPKMLAKSSAKVLILAAASDAASCRAAMLAGARGILGKEAHPDEIVQAIAQVHAGGIWLNRSISHGLLHELLPEPNKAPAALTPRERQVVNALTQTPDAPLKDIAGTLEISDQTLRNHLSSIYDKLAVSGRLQLYLYATRGQLN